MAKNKQVVRFMLITIKEISWLAGLWEGEGCFSSTGTGILMRLGMTDKDVVGNAEKLDSLVLL